MEADMTEVIPTKVGLRAISMKTRSESAILHPQESPNSTIFWSTTV